MGQNISNQPKLSSEITLNRIRTTCQRDDKMPAELKNFNIALLANDLNTLGMDIPLVDKHGRKRSSDDICRDIKNATYPDVQNVCMISSAREAHSAVDTMVSMFNKNYGARIQLYKDPLNKSKGKRSVSELCDDLYLVLDKVHRKLTDQPRVIKQKLEEMISQLEERKSHIQSRMIPVIANIQNARENDKTDEKINNANIMYNATNSLLNAQLQGAYKLTANTVKELDLDQLGNLDGMGTGSFGQNLGNLKSSLHNYESGRWTQNRPISSTVQNLLVAATSSGLALNDCQKCKRSLGVGDIDPDDIQRHTKLRNALASKLIGAKSDEATRELFKCYDTLAREAGCREGVAGNQALFNTASDLGDFTRFGSTADADLTSLLKGFVRTANNRSGRAGSAYGAVPTATVGTGTTAGATV